METSSEIVMEKMTSHEIAEQERNNRLIRNLYGDMRSLVEYLDDDAVTDIAVQDSGEIIISRFGQGRVFTGRAISDVTAHRIILSTASAVGAKIDAYAGFPKLEAFLPGEQGKGARFTGLLPPKVARPSFSIRKPAKKIYTLEQYVENGQMTDVQYGMIVDHVKKLSNIVIAGQTGCGKTTLTNAVIKKMEEFTPKANFYIVEDVPELQCSARMKVTICTDKNSAHEAVEEALRFNPDRIIFGEVRNSSVMSALATAWNTGHKGSVTTIHANTCASTVRRIRKLLEQGEDRSSEKISDIIQLVVHLSKNEKGIHVDEVLEVSDEE